MICYQLFGENDEMIEVARQVLKNTPDECLVLIDGIDEWKGSVNAATGRRGDIPGLPSRKGLEECVILSTSRPERIHMLPTKLDKTCSVLELHGIQGVSQLIYSVLREAEYPDPLQSCSEFLSQVRRSHLDDLIQFPLMLVNALNLWEMNKTLSNSMPVNYSNMVEGLFTRAKDADRIEQHDKQRRNVISADLPDCFRHTDWCKRNAGLLIKLGELAFDLMFGDDQNSSLIFSGQQIRKYLTETELKTCLAVGILSKAQTISRNYRKIDSFSFCHKTFQEFLGALWLSIEQSEPMSMFLRQFRSTTTVYDNGVFLLFLCGLSLSAGDRFWQYIAEEVTEKDEKINEWRLKTGPIFASESKVPVLQRLALQCINEARNADLEQHRQLIYFIPDIYIDMLTDERDITLINGLVEKYVADIKSVTLVRKIPSDIVKSINKMQSAISIRICGDIFNRPSMPELQFPDQLKTLSVGAVNIPSAIKFPKHLTSFTVMDIKLSHSGIEELCSCLRVSSTLRYLRLESLSCSDHGDRCCLPTLDLQRHHSLEKVILGLLSVESVLLPGQGAIHLPITTLDVRNIKLSHSGIEQLYSCFRVSSTLRYLDLDDLSCSDHGDSCCLPALDLQRHHLTRLSVGIITLSHNDIEQLWSCLRVSSTLRYLHLRELSCSDHGDRCCLAALDLQRHHSLEEVRLPRLSVESVPLPGQGAIPLPITTLAVSSIKLSHSGIEQFCSCLRVSSTLRYLELDDLSCSDHGDSCCLPALDIQRHHSLETVELSRLSVESVLLPGQLERQQARDLQEIPTFDIKMRWVKMSSQGWRNWLDSLPHPPYRLTVKLKGCDIDEDLKSHVLSCSNFTVTKDNTRCFF